MKIRFQFWLILIMLVWLGFTCQSVPHSSELNSPDGKIRIIVQNQPDENRHKVLSYTVEYHSNEKVRMVIESSRLGLVRDDQNFGHDLTLLEISPVKVINENYRMLTGKRAHNRNYAHERRFVFQNENEARMEIIFRAYNEGIAFKYFFPAKDENEYTITEELTAFKLPPKGKAWIQPNDTLRHWCMAYEKLYERSIPIGTRAPISTGWLFPALFHVDDCWLLISEANVQANYCASHLAADAPDGEYKIEFPWEFEGLGVGNRFPSSTLPWETPWRLVIMGNQLGRIVESNLVHHLSKPNQLEDVTWIEPGKVTWSWWSDHSSSMDFQKLKKYIDFAAEIGWKYSLVDADWNIMQGGTIEELVKYANAKDVGLFLWYNSGGPHNAIRYFFTVSEDALKNLTDENIAPAVLNGLGAIKNNHYFAENEYLAALSDAIGAANTALYKDIIYKYTRFQNAGPHDLMHLPDIRQAEFKKISEWGVKGVKVDFFQSDKQASMQLYLDIFKAAAQYQLLVNTHGCTLPRGWSRTYPNLMSMEAVMGAEMYGWNEWPQHAVIQNTLYPYLRNVVGPMDYTPVTFSDYNPEFPHLTTNAHELALSMIFESGIVHLADCVESYQSLPPEVYQFIKQVPVTWDDIHFIDGFPGEFTVLARRKGTKYYLAGINGKMQAKALNFTLPFLKAGTYILRLITDGENPRTFRFETREMTAGDSVQLEMLPAGGFVGIVFQKN